MNGTDAVTLEEIRSAVAQELRAWDKENDLREKESDAGVSAEETEKEREKKPLFSAVAGLFSMDEELEALKEALTAVERELAALREDFAEERQRAAKAEEALKKENSRLLSELDQLRETEDTIHMRVFDNRVRIGELQEELEKRTAANGEKEEAAER